MNPAHQPTTVGTIATPQYIAMSPATHPTLVILSEAKDLNRSMTSMQNTGFRAARMRE
jgi:hypothetical protein